MAWLTPLRELLIGRRTKIGLKLEDLLPPLPRSSWGQYCLESTRTEVSPQELRTVKQLFLQMKVRGGMLSREQHLSHRLPTGRSSVEFQKATVKCKIKNYKVKI